MNILDDKIVCDGSRLFWPSVEAVDGHFMAGKRYLINKLESPSPIIAHCLPPLHPLQSAAPEGGRPITCIP